MARARERIDDAASFRIWLFNLGQSDLCPHDFLLFQTLAESGIGHRKPSRTDRSLPNFLIAATGRGPAVATSVGGWRRLLPVRLRNIAATDDDHERWRPDAASNRLRHLCARAALTTLRTGVEAVAEESEIVRFRPSL